MATTPDDEDARDEKEDWLDNLLDSGDPAAPVDDILDSDEWSSQRIQRNRNRTKPEDGPDE
ncbi:hypothetical protein [Streptomyces nogalater]|uniref:Uncharacterized protein n=1 Tax=Streptomyces nogalater TaxID=38314 RepID=A0ABW0WDG4_STRNO